MHGLQQPSSLIHMFKRLQKLAMLIERSGRRSNGSTSSTVYGITARKTVFVIHFL